MAISNYMNQIGNTINMLFIAFIVPFVAFYILKDFQIIEKTALAIVPREHRKRTIKSAHRYRYCAWELYSGTIASLRDYWRARLFGVLAYWDAVRLLLASVVAVFNIIPYFGPFFGAAPAIIMASTISLKMVLFVALVNLTVQILEGNVISPQVVGKKATYASVVYYFCVICRRGSRRYSGINIGCTFLCGHESYYSARFPSLCS